MKPITVIALLFAIGSPALAAEHDRHAGHGAQQAAAEYVNAEVRKVDRENGKITLKHEALKQFDMAAMTMAFRVADPALLDGLAVGDAVRFVPGKVNGQLVVTKIEKRN